VASFFLPSPSSFFFLLLLLDDMVCLVVYGLEGEERTDLMDEVSGIPISVRNTSGSAIFGTPGYICPWYSHWRKTFEESCEVMAF
jgi:hypothetical protein